MEKKHYFLKLIARRPDFAQTMTDEERAVMQKHVAYLKEYLDKGIMLIYGPVFDPAGAYGIGVMEVTDESEVRDLIANDPAAEINRYEFYPMRAVTKLS